MRLYADDSDGAWPGIGVWEGWNRTEATKLVGCPLSVIPPEKQLYIQARGRVVGYAYNSALFDWNDTFVEVDGNPEIVSHPTTDKDILYPAATVAFFDASYQTVATYAPDPNSHIAPYPYGAERGWERHNGGANYLFCDNHVSWLHAEQVLPGIPQTNDGTKPAFALSTRGK